MSNTIERTETGVAQNLDATPPLEWQLMEDTLRDICEHGIEYTQTFLPCLSMRWRPSTLVTILSDILKSYQKRYEFRVILIGEYSPLGRFHLHGSIQCSPQMISSMKRKITREIGQFHIKEIKYCESYIKYCLKDEYSGKTKEIPMSELIILNNMK